MAPVSWKEISPIRGGRRGRGGGGREGGKERGREGGKEGREQRERKKTEEVGEGGARKRRRKKMEDEKNSRKHDACQFTTRCNLETMSCYTRTRCRDLTKVVTLGLPRDTLPYIVVDGVTIR